MTINSEQFWKKPRIRDYIEYYSAKPLVFFLNLFPLEFVSNLLAIVGRTIGPRIALSRRARENIRLVWPHLEQHEIEKIIFGVWNNLSRIGTEYWSLETIRNEQHQRIKIVGRDNLEKAETSGKPCIFFTGHIGNWEIVTLAIRMHNIPVTLVYRPINNPLIDAHVRNIQRQSGVELIMKGPKGAKRLIDIVKNKGHTIMLVDVRMNDGINVPFLGVNAMTPSAPASLAIKYDALLVPVRVERKSAASYKVTIEKPQKPTNTGNRKDDILKTMTWVNERLSQWITERPEQWIWFHRRWGKNRTE